METANRMSERDLLRGETTMATMDETRLAASAHQVLRSITTPLTVVRSDAPTLEDAYLEIVGRASLE